MRTLPNIIITGTPGVGKTRHCEHLQARFPQLPLTHLSINDVVKDRGCHEGYDEGSRSWIVDEDKLLDSIEDEVNGEGEGEGGGEGKGGNLIDWHACEPFPERWVDLVVVLRCKDTALMYDRLVGRNYHGKKLQENLDAEIFGVLLDEAFDSYDREIVVELNSETDEDIERNCERIGKWIENWRREQNQKK